MKNITRRSFIKKATAGTAIAGFPMIVPRSVLGGPKHIPPSEKLNIAGIGIGWMGGVNMANVTSQNIVALCDVDYKHAANAFKAYPNAKTYKDYRVMLEKQKDIDAVIIGTPDHTHAVISMAAFQAGKHVYCQKPLTHNIKEARVLAEAAREAGVITQMGIQGHSNEGLSLLCEWIQGGVIGEVHEVDASCSLSYYPFGHASWSTTHSRPPKEVIPVPDTLDWDLWLGPAPKRAYHPCYHPQKWRAWLDFGCGMMGDRGVHTFDPIVSALKLGYPDSVDAVCMGGNEHIHPLSSILTYKFPARKGFPPLKLTWYEGMQMPRPEELEEGRSLPNEGCIIFKGTKGKIMGHWLGGKSPRLIPESKMRETKFPEKTLPRIKMSHEMHWVDCCKKGVQPGANFDYSGPLTEIVHLGNVAKRCQGNVLKWDGPNMRVTNLEKANQYIGREYRKGWTL